MIKDVIFLFAKRINSAKSLISSLKPEKASLSYFWLNPGFVFVPGKQQFIYLAEIKWKKYKHALEYFGYNWNVCLKTYVMSFFKNILAPSPLPYDLGEWKKLPFALRAKKVCQAWALQGFGAPFSGVLFYVLKILFYVYMWFFFCSFSTDLGSMSEVTTWWFKLEALWKAILWTTLLEVIGFGGASGPLTGRYMPPLGGITYFLRPGTLKAPMFPRLPLLGYDQRTLLDALLYIAVLVSLLRVCLAPQISPDLIWPLVILIPLAGILDRTVYLAARGDIYYPMILCMLFPVESGPALKMMWFGIWFWAAFSKLTPNFTSVICVMICNSPFFNLKIFDGFKKSLFKNYPEDLRPSNFANYVAHFGTLVEFSMPIALLFLTGNSTLSFYALVIITAFHFFIFINFPMGVPMEWNVIMVYGGWMLYYAQPEWSFFQISEPFLFMVLAVSIVLLPILGNLFPKYVSFLLSMRYYAGTWAYSVWLFRGECKEKLDQKLQKTSKEIKKQLSYFYDRPTSEAILSRMIAFRMMHLPGRMLQFLLPKAVDNIDEYEWAEGEFVAGEVIGWNFGDGHLHSEAILESIQKRCDFAPADLRVIMVESPQFHTQKLAWRIYDAADGLVEKGFGKTAELQKKMPWPEK